MTDFGLAKRLETEIELILSGQLAGGDDYTIKLWNFESQQEAATLRGHTHLVSALAFSPDATTSPFAPNDGSVIRRNDDGSRTVIASDLNFPVGMAESPEGNALFVSMVGYGQGTTEGLGKTVRITEIKRPRDATSTRFLKHNARHKIQIINLLTSAV